MTTAKDIKFTQMPDPNQLGLEAFAKGVIPDAFLFMAELLTTESFDAEPSVQDMVDYCVKAIQNNDILNNSARVGVAAGVLIGLACACAQKKQEAAA